MNQVPARARPLLPRIGFGTYGLEGESCTAAVASAIEAGYRLLDCAEVYGNEEQVGRAVSMSGVARDELFIISKFWFTHNHPSDMRRALRGSLERLGVESVDLYMLHWPSADMDLPALLAALEEEKAEGRIARIGICNFPVSRLVRLLEESDAVDAVELEWHVYLDQSRAQSLLSERSIPFIAYCPLAQGRIAQDPVLAEIAARLGVTSAAVALAWLLSHDGVTAIPRAASRHHQLANLAAEQVRLTAEDRDRIARLPKNIRLADFPFSPRWDD